MYLKLGSVDTIVVSSPLSAEQILKTHDQAFAGRPGSEFSKYFYNDQRGLSYAQYGKYWRTIRKISILHMLSNRKVQSFQPMRRHEVWLLVESLKHAALQGVTVDLSAMVSSVSANMSCLMVFGKKYMDDDFDEKGFKDVTKEAMELFGSPNVSDFFPFLRRFDLQGIRRRSKAVSKTYHDFFEKIICEHEEIENEKQKDDITFTLLDLMKSGEAEFPYDRRHVKAIMFDLLVASMDTSSTVVEWALSELIRNPHIMKKVQKELEENVGMERSIEESDMANLKYLEMVIKETLRLHPVVPLLLPHEALEDCTVDGFYIPKKSRIMINAWAIGRDPNAWSNPEKFMPERFLGRNIDVMGKNFELIPFGSGRRSCPGLHLGFTAVKLLIAQLVHCFDWELPNGMVPSMLDMTEQFGLVMYRATPLMAIPRYRLRK